MSSSFSSIPILDLSLANSPSTRPALLADLHHAFTDVGFLYIKNHSVDPSTVEDLTSALPSLFALPAAAKDSCALHNSPHFLGYSGFGSEWTARNVDLREQFEFGTPLTKDDIPEDGELWTGLYGANQWPIAHPSIKPILERYISELTALSTNFLSLIEEAFSLPKGVLHPYLSSQHRLKLVHYASTDDGSTATQGVGPHKDSSGWLTFLLQASPPPIGGLQALNHSGEWIDVPAIPGTFVVNIGQAFEVVSGGICPATTHRVVSGSATRYSVPFFQGVRGDVTKSHFGALWEHFRPGKDREDVARTIDSSYLKSEVDSWGEWQLRTKVRSHPDIGKRFYADVFEDYIRAPQD